MPSFIPKRRKSSKNPGKQTKDTAGTVQTTSHDQPTPTVIASSGGARSGMSSSSTLPALSTFTTSSPVSSKSGIPTSASFSGVSAARPTTTTTSPVKSFINLSRSSRAAPPPPIAVGTEEQPSRSYIPAYIQYKAPPPPQGTTSPDPARQSQPSRSSHRSTGSHGSNGLFYPGPTATSPTLPTTSTSLAQAKGFEQLPPTPWGLSSAEEALKKDLALDDFSPPIDSDRPAGMPGLERVMSPTAAGFEAGPISPSPSAWFLNNNSRMGSEVATPGSKVGDDLAEEIGKGVMGARKSESPRRTPVLQQASQESPDKGKRESVVSQEALIDEAPPTPELGYGEYSPTRTYRTMSLNKSRASLEHTQSATSLLTKLATNSTPNLKSVPSGPSPKSSSEMLSPTRRTSRVPVPQYPTTPFYVGAPISPAATTPKVAEDTSPTRARTVSQSRTTPSKTPVHQGIAVREDAPSTPPQSGGSGDPRSIVNGDVLDSPEGRPSIQDVLGQGRSRPVSQVGQGLTAPKPVTDAADPRSAPLPESPMAETPPPTSMAMPSKDKDDEGSPTPMPGSTRPAYLSRPPSKYPSTNGYYPVSRTSPGPPVTAPFWAGAPSPGVKSPAPKMGALKEDTRPEEVKPMQFNEVEDVAPKEQKLRPDSPPLTPPPTAKEDLPFTGEFASRREEAGNAKKVQHAGKPRPVTIYQTLAGLPDIEVQSKGTDTTASQAQGFIPRLLRPRVSVQFSWNDMILPSVISINPVRINNGQSAAQTGPLLKPEERDALRRKRSSLLLPIDAGYAAASYAYSFVPGGGK